MQLTIFQFTDLTVLLFELLTDLIHWHMMTQRFGNFIDNFCCCVTCCPYIITLHTHTHTHTQSKNKQTEILQERKKKGIFIDKHKDLQSGFLSLWSLCKILEDVSRWCHCWTWCRRLLASDKTVAGNPHRLQCKNHGQTKFFFENNTLTCITAYKQDLAYFTIQQYQVMKKYARNVTSVMCSHY